LRIYQTRPLEHRQLEQRVLLVQQEPLERLELLLALELLLVLEPLLVQELLLVQEPLLEQLVLLLELAVRTRKWSRHLHQRSKHSLHMVQPLESCRQLRIRRQRLRWQPTNHIRRNRLQLVLEHKLELGLERCS